MKKIYCFADSIFEIEPTFDYFFDFAKEYEITSKEVDYKISTTKEEIEAWANEHEDAKGFSLDYIETLVLHAKIASLLSKEFKFIFHGSTIYVDSLDNCYIFTAPSGTGKSTHVRILRKVYEGKINYVNDDKPFIAYKDGHFYVYGSPWNGKERLSNNLKGELKGIFVLSRSKTNEVSELSHKEAITKLAGQMYFPKGIEETLNATQTMIKLVNNIPMYSLRVNMEDDAAKVSYEIMKKGEK